MADTTTKTAGILPLFFCDDCNDERPHTHGFYVVDEHDRQVAGPYWCGWYAQGDADDLTAETGRFHSVTEPNPPVYD